MSNAARAIGTTLKKGINAIAELTEISGVNLTADTIDVTTLSSTGGYREFIAGFKDAGEVSISGFFYPGDTTGQYALYTDFLNGTIGTYTISFPAALGASWEFTGIVTGYTTAASLEDPVSFEATIKISGQPTLSVTASTGLSALTVTGTGATLNPTFANGTYYYTADGISATSVTVTAIAASHTIDMYIDGVFSQVLTTAVASNAIALTLNVSKKVTIVARESGKTAKTYEIILVKAS